MPSYVSSIYTMVLKGPPSVCDCRVNEGVPELCAPIPLCCVHHEHTVALWLYHVHGNLTHHEKWPLSSQVSSATGLTTGGPLGHFLFLWKYHRFKKSFGLKVNFHPWGWIQKTTQNSVTILLFKKTMFVGSEGQCGNKGERGESVIQLFIFSGT